MRLKVEAVEEKVEAVEGSKVEGAEDSPVIMGTFKVALSFSDEAVRGVN